LRYPAEMDIIERVLHEATAKSKDGRIDQTEFLNYAASSSRYSLFTPMEASIIFHFAGRGAAGKRLALIDFAQLLDPRWRAPGDIDGAVVETTASTASTMLSNLAQSAYNFVQGGKHIQIFKNVTLKFRGRYRRCVWGDNRVPDRSRYVIAACFLLSCSTFLICLSEGMVAVSSNGQGTVTYRDLRFRVIGCRRGTY
jgi:hypothetical protein